MKFKSGDIISWSLNEGVLVLLIQDCCFNTDSYSFTALEGYTSMTRCSSDTIDGLFKLDNDYKKRKALEKEIDDWLK